MDAALYYRIVVASGGATYDLSRDIASLTWEQDDGKPDQLVLVVPDGAMVMGHALREGMTIELTFGTDVEHAVVFRGRIYGAESQVPPAGIPVLTIKALDRSAEMGMHTKPRRWDEKPLSTVVNDVLAAYEFTGKHVALGVDPEVIVVQGDRSDLELLAELCEHYGCSMYVEQQPDGEHLHFVGKAQLADAEPELQLFHGRCGVAHGLAEFHATVDARRAEVPRLFTGIDRRTGEMLAPITIEPRSPGKVDDLLLADNLAQIADADKRDRLQALIDAAATAEAEMRKLRLADHGVQVARSKPPLTTAEELKLQADNWVRVNALGMNGAGSSAGLPGLRARSTIELLGVGGRFSGKWFVSQVRHMVGRDGYHTEFNCQR